MNTFTVYVLTRYSISTTLIMFFIDLSFFNVLLKTVQINTYPSSHIRKCYFTALKIYAVIPDSVVEGSNEHVSNPLLM